MGRGRTRFATCANRSARNRSTVSVLDPAPSPREPALETCEVGDRLTPSLAIDVAAFHTAAAGAHVGAARPTPLRTEPHSRRRSRFAGCSRPLPRPDKSRHEPVQRTDWHPAKSPNLHGAGGAGSAQAWRCSRWPTCARARPAPTWPADSRSVLHGLPVSALRPGVLFGQAQVSRGERAGHRLDRAAGVDLTGPVWCPPRHGRRPRTWRPRRPGRGRRPRSGRHRRPGRRPERGRAAAASPPRPGDRPLPDPSRNQKQVNAAHARQRGPGERVNAELKNWKILLKSAQAPAAPASSSQPFRPS